MLKSRHIPIVLSLLATLALSQTVLAADPPLKALIIDGRTNRWHDWKATSPVLKEIIEGSELFQVDRATAPKNDADVTNFKPDFSKYDLLVVNYEGIDWPESTRKAFTQFIRDGGGVIIYHAANNAFADWAEYNDIIGLGGWGGRKASAGPMVRFRDGKTVLDNSPGGCGDHGPQHEFQLVHRDADHPITAGLPLKWMHTKDELYSKLRGPAKNLTLLASAYSDPAKPKGTGENEPILFTIQYGKGRVFHTTLGHAAANMQCVGFIFTLQRGAEWAATGKVTQTKVPKDFPTAEKASTRPLGKLAGK